MRHALTHTIAGDEIRIFMPDTRDDIAGFRSFLAQGDAVLGVDTESTGLDIFGTAHKLRLVQFGNRDEAWVLHAQAFADDIREALRQDRHFVVHNAPFDLLTFDRHLGVKVEEMARKTFDTRIFAHLVDPRRIYEGGVGLSLKELAAYYVDPAAPDTQAGLNEVFRKEYKATKETGWAAIDIDHEVYIRYAGLDPVLTRRLFDELKPIITNTDRQNELSKFEHRLQAILATVQRRGLRMDVPYISQLDSELIAEEEEFAGIAAQLGVENTNSTAQVAAALTAQGETLSEKTASGKPKVDKAVLLPMADLDMAWQRIGAREPNPLADAVLRSKRAGKWRTSYVEQFMELLDGDGRIHPVINALQARTARMSVSRPPLQQLPSGEWRIRRAIIADPGQVIGACDYAQVELRVLAALAGVQGMKDAIVEGVDLHDATARMVFGEDFTKAQRKLAKGVGFGKVYGGGAATLSRQTGSDIESVKEVVARYNRVYPEIARFSRKLQDRALSGKFEVVTVTGRHLPLDRDRAYAALNYVIQSTARDVLAQAIIRLDEAGLSKHILMPVHDELIWQAPEADAKEIGEQIRSTMEMDLLGVHIGAELEIYGTNWGLGYGGS